eukprot:TRINITY_DN3682_c2_g1_i1.p1 TRINITY_DN3682_c2_g1~~TRINITY_DN3682_c2_g1_i1.p1  ORF type:complete len:929 (-),score=206.54 TRINITY_DN3682_c2_g1_i1:185-2722(-)
MPPIPSARADKVNFLQKLINLTAATLGEGSGEILSVSANDIVCGVRPEWTNYLLQGISVAAFPVVDEQALAHEAEQARLAAEAEAAAQAAEAEAAAHAAAEAAAAAAAAEAQASAAAAAAEAKAAQDAEAARVWAEQVAAQEANVEAAQAAAEAAKAAAEAAEAAAAAPLPEHEPVEVAGPSINVETAKGLAKDLEFSAFLQDLNSAHADLSRTVGCLGTTGGWDAQADDGEADVQATEADAAGATDGQAGEGVRPTTGAPLKKAAEVAEKVTAQVTHATDLLATIEAGLEDFDQEVTTRKEQEKQYRQALQEQRFHEQTVAAQKAAAIAAAEAEEIAREEAEEAQLAAEEKAVRRAAKEAAREAKEAKRAEKEAAAKAAEEAEAKARAQYPMSKASMNQTARMVTCVGGGDDYEWDGDGADDEGGAQSGTATAGASAVPEVSVSPPPPADDHMTGGLGACLTDALLAPATPEKADPLFGFSPSPAPSQPADVTRLFDRLKVQLKDTFVSYLCASMPATLLKQYDPDELIQCLQTLLAELRKCVQVHNLEDVTDEDPTSVSEAMREAYPKDWVYQLQHGSSWAFRSKYDTTEVVDTLQILAQTCFERLTDELGPIHVWADESHPLRYIPPEVLRSPSPASETEGPWSSQLTPAPWEASPTAPRTDGYSRGSPSPSRTGQSTAHGRGSPSPGRSGLATASRARGSPSPTRAATGATGGAAFNKTLGPAPWEQPPTTAAPAAPFSADLAPPIWETGATSQLPGTAAPRRMPGTGPATAARVVGMGSTTAAGFTSGTAGSRAVRGSPTPVAGGTAAVRGVARGSPSPGPAGDRSYTASHSRGSPLMQR